MTLEVRAFNEVARQLYSTLGFRQEGRRRGYYTDTGEDALIMWKRLLVPDVCLK
jgi:ribosomal-protein-alanine N-acetyltransferase